MTRTLSAKHSAVHTEEAARNAGTAESVNLGALLQDSYVEDYDRARLQYKSSHARFSARVKSTTAPLRASSYCAQAFHDLSYYTSVTDPATCCLPPTCTHGERLSGLHALNAQLLRQGCDRLRATPAKASHTMTDVFALLALQEAAEYAGICDLEAVAFEELARLYYNTMLGSTNRIVALEARARRNFEDDCSHATSQLLAVMRAELWAAEQKLLKRASRVSCDALAHVPQSGHRIFLSSQQALSASQQQRQQEHCEAATELDSRDAVPLWHHTSIIRAETESDEDIEFRRLELACAVIAYALQGGYLRRNYINGFLQWSGKPVPVSMLDGIRYALQFEQMIMRLNEETARMALVDAAEQAWTNLFLSQ